jgi:succinoglycan biosynthesis transport protein ExoP
MQDSGKPQMSNGVPTAPVIDDEGIDIIGYLRIVRRRWLIILLAVILSVGAAAFITLRMSKIYQATTTVRIETQAPQVLGRGVEDVSKMGTGSFWSNIEYYETQYKIIESRDVASRVVLELGLNKDPEFLGIPVEERTNFRPANVDEAAEILQRMLSVRPVKDSRLVTISVSHYDPKRARLYANAVAKAYVDKNLESMLQNTVDAVDWLSKQLDDAHKTLTQSEEKIRDYKKEQGILSVSLQDRQNMLAAQMTAVATRLTEARAERIVVQARKSAIAKVVKSKDALAVPLNSINSNWLIQQLKQEHGKLSREYGELSERYGANFPAMKEIKAKLERIEKDIDREVKNILKSIDAELSVASSTEVGLKKALDEFRTQAFELAQKELVYNQFERDKVNNEKIYDLLLGRTKEAGLSRLLQVNNVEILDSALLPEVPIKPRLRVNLALALVIGLILGLGLAFLLEFADRTIKTPDDLDALGVAFLGIVPSIDTASDGSATLGYQENGKKIRTKAKKKETTGKDGVPIETTDLFIHEHPQSQVAESCRAVRTNLLFMTADNPVKRILVTSPAPQEGKTAVAINLAIAMAQSGSSVLLVDTDMRRPRIHRAFGQKRTSRGISTMMVGESTAEESISHTQVPNLDLLTCGPTPPNPAELMHTDRFARIADELGQLYDRVIFDSPPVAVVTDAAVLSKLVDGTVLVVKSMQTTRESAKHAVGVLRDIEANILGAVLNDLDLTSRKYGKHYYHYYYTKYGDYYELNRPSDVPPPPGRDSSDVIPRPPT